MARRSIAKLALSTLLAAPLGMAFASEGLEVPDMTQAVGNPKMVAEMATPKRISGDAGVVFATDYISRGIQLENQGLVSQPYADLYFKAYEGKAGSETYAVTLFGGIWSSLHSEHTGTSGNTVDAWYEFDWDIGFAVDYGKFNLNVMYIEFISPNNAFGTAHNLQFSLAYSDGGEWTKGISWTPYVTVFVELDGKAGTGSDEGVYIELGIKPTMELTKGKYALSLTLPVKVGLGVADFYGDADGDDKFFGYAAAGAVVSMPIDFLNDGGFGSWTLSAGGYVYYFGDGVKDANKAIGTDSEWDFMGQVAIEVKF